MNNFPSGSPFSTYLPPLNHRAQIPPVLPPQTASSPMVEESPERKHEETPVANVRATTANHNNEEIIEDPHFSYDGYQVVRGEFFSHMNEPSITFCDNRFSVNAACLKKAPNTDYVQVLVHQEQKKLVVRPCSEDRKDSFAWCTIRRKPKKVICALFFAKIMSLMNWNPEHRYKIIGKLIHSQGQYLFVFDLNSPEIYKRSVQIDENGNEKRKVARKPAYLDSWREQFGLPVEEHQNNLQISFFEEYALFAVSERKPKEKTIEVPSEEVQNEQSENYTMDPR